MPRVKLTPEQLEAKLRKIPAKDLIKNLCKVEQLAVDKAIELTNLELVADSYRKVAKERMIELRCGQA